MGFVRSWLLPAAAFLAFAGVAAAQTTNGTISGHVSDPQGLAVHGATVKASSPNLQGVRSVVTSENGDYVISLLPSGIYTITFELSGFERVAKQVTLAPTQNLPLSAQLGPAAVSETIVVTGHAADILVQTTTIATNFKQDLIATLPTTRDLDAVMLQAPEGTRHRSQRFLLDCRRNVIRKPLPHQRRHGQREHSRSVRESVHRRRDSGNDGRVRRHFGGIRPLHRRRRELGDQVRRQPLHRLFPGHAEQRQLAQPRREAARRHVRQRHAARQGDPDLRVHDRRPDPEGPTLVLPRRTRSDAGVQPSARDHERPVYQYT